MSSDRNLESSRKKALVIKMFVCFFNNIFHQYNGLINHYTVLKVHGVLYECT